MTKQKTVCRSSSQYIVQRKSVFVTFRYLIMAVEGGAKCIKILLFVFNFIFFVSSLSFPL